MARSHIAVAVGAATFCLAIVFFLAANLGLPDVDFWHWRFAPASEDFTSYDQLQQHLFGEKADSDGDLYMLGVGKADITGPVVEINLMGYANVSQVGSGLRQRLYSRAFIIGSTDDASSRFVYLVVDTQSGDTAVRDGILTGLKDLGGDYAQYTQSNVAMTGTHSHSGPGAWLNYLLPQITSKGFDKQSYEAIVSGALLSIQRAHESLTEGRLSVGTTEIEDANINRSLYAYLANPEEERAQYSANIDKTLTLLKFQRASDGVDMGVLTWFAVHGTSILGNNTIVAADNKGVAAYLFEQAVKSDNADFVAGFSQANVGDTSPNINGAWCEDGSNMECRFEDSTCGDPPSSQDCHGRGPYFGLNDGGMKSCYEIGRKQYAGAKSLYDSMVSGTSTPVSGPVRALHTFKDFSTFHFTLPNGTLAKTCPAALGYSFAAGTTDGPGAFDFKQNDSGAPNASPVWAVVSNLLHAANETQKECQGEKPILLDVGETHTPYDWSPNIVDIQLLRVGNLFMIISPGEATTMSGRRWRNAVSSLASSAGLTDEPVVVLGGPANSYTHYIATEEEYNIQRYEGASTLYGPHTLNAYINLTLDYLPYLAQDTSGLGVVPVGPLPPINTNRSLSFITGVVYDAPGIFKSYGDVVTAPSSAYTRGSTIKVTFVGANPRNNLRLEGTFAAIEKKGSDGAWTQVKSDDDWELLYEWRRVSGVLGTSEVDITWYTNSDSETGTYRVHYYGDSKALGGKITAFEGTSGSFTLT